MIAAYKPVSYTHLILESEFRSVYEERTQETLSRLFKTLNDGTFYNHIISEFSTLQARLFHLGKELDQYKEQEGRIQANDPMLAQIKNLIKATKKQYAQDVYKRQTVNCVGVMGKGIALVFKLRYPEMFDKYKVFCQSKMIGIGKLWLYKSEESTQWVLNFPTKFHWKYPSKIEYLRCV